LLAAAERESAEGDADPYMTALCYFNALRELGGARRIVEDEVRARLASYGTERRRVAPLDQPFADRRLRDLIEITSRESTDKVAAAKEALAAPAVCRRPFYGFGPPARASAWKRFTHTRLAAQRTYRLQRGRPTSAHVGADGRDWLVATTVRIVGNRPHIRAAKPLA